MRELPLLIFVGLLAFSMAAGAPAAQDEDLDALNRQIEELHAKGKNSEAIALAKRYAALTEQRSGQDSLEYATAVTWLASLYQSEGDAKEAERLFQRALTIREKLLGTDHAQVATSLGNLAAFYRLQGRGGDAKPLLERAAAIRAKAQGSDEIEALKGQAEALRLSGRTAEAIAPAERYRDLVRDRYGDAHPDMADAMALLLALYQAEGRDEEAKELKRALALRKDAPGQGGDRKTAAAPPAPADDPNWRNIFRKAPEEPKTFREAKTPANDASQPSYAVVKVYYATDRERTENSDPAKAYGRDRGEVTYGICAVSIPRDHRMGALEKPSIWRLEWSNDPDKHVVLLSVMEQEKSAFFRDVADRIAKSAGANAFVFVHGYNVTFADAARRTAQMAYDLGFDGAPVFYSWPSQASYGSYNVDETNAQWSEIDFRDFLKEFVEKSGADNVFLIAHSMGTRVLTGALGDLLPAEPEVRDKIKEIILAAPDIDADTFKRDIAPRILSPDRPATLYASSGDYALTASKHFAGYRRVGDTAGGVTVLEGLDTIDATGIRTDFVGHSYYGSSESVLGDLRNLILSRKRADQRSGLRSVESPAGRYWSFSR
jgi:esterase/lipase superfamily enzyme/tetratricopeptide (TPR) repeat protein